MFVFIFVLNELFKHGIRAGFMEQGLIPNTAFMDPTLKKNFE